MEGRGVLKEKGPFGADHTRAPRDLPPVPPVRSWAGRGRCGQVNLLVSNSVSCLVVLRVGDCPTRLVSLESDRSLSNVGASGPPEGPLAVLSSPASGLEGSSCAVLPPPPARGPAPHSVVGHGRRSAPRSQAAPMRGGSGVQFADTAALPRGSCIHSVTAKAVFSRVRENSYHLPPS